MNKKLKQKLAAAELDHVAVAVSNLEKAVKVYEMLGLTFEAKREVVEREGVKTAFAPLNTQGAAHLELLWPLNDKSKIHEFIQKRGEGIHHLCFKVEDIKAKCEELKASGFTLIYSSPMPGARGCLVNFIHPKSTGGVLIELSQPSEDD